MTMTTATIIAAETFGVDNEYRLDVLVTRFGDLEYFIELNGETIRQSHSIAQTIDGLRDVVGIGDATDRAFEAVTDHFCLSEQRA